MAHSLIIGMSESGKTTLARGLCHYYKSQGRGTLVLDPLNDPRWRADYQTTNAEEFLEVMRRSKSCYCFIDEGGQMVGRYNVEMQWCATQARHWGHSCHFIAQGATQLAPIVRDMCSHLFLFCCAKRNGVLLAEDWNEPLLERCADIPQYGYFHASKFGPLVQHFGSFKNESVRSSQRPDSDSRGAVHARKEEEKRTGQRASGATGVPNSNADAKPGDEVREIEAKIKTPNSDV